MNKGVVIVGAVRTPIGRFKGELLPYSAPQLGAVAIAGAVEQSKVDPLKIDDVMMGCVLTAGLGQAPQDAYNKELMGVIAERCSG